MNLATRCNACGTVFRVVRDQLRVSDGWVRCGRCQAVFHATDDLFELDGPQPSLPAHDAPPGPGPVSSEPGALARRLLDELAAERRQALAAAESVPSAAPVRPATGLHDEVMPALPDIDLPAESAAADQEPVLEPAEAAPVDRAEARAETLVCDAGAADVVPTDDGRPAAIVSWEATPRPADGPAATPPLPSFVVRADRAAFWRTPWMRSALAASALLLSLALALQVVHAGRDEFAARFPALAPAIEDLCRVTGCRISPLRRIDRLSVDSAGLSLLEGAQIYKLQLVLHNRADTALLAPALELSLNDAQGTLVARRVLRGAELGLDSPVIGAGQEMPLTVMLATPRRHIAGYKLELFYP